MEYLVNIVTTILGTPLYYLSKVFEAFFNQDGQAILVQLVIAYAVLIVFLNLRQKAKLDRQKLILQEEARERFIESEARKLCSDPIFRNAVGMPIIDHLADDAPLIRLLGDDAPIIPQMGQPVINDHTNYDIQHIELDLSAIDISDLSAESTAIDLNALADNDDIGSF